jgi:hypothetical protein
MSGTHTAGHAEGCSVNNFPFCNIGLHWWHCDCLVGNWLPLTDWRAFVPLTKASLLAGVLACALVAATASVYATPVLQVGAPASGGTCAAGPYVLNTSSSTNPTENDTAIVSGNSLCVAGVYGPNTLFLGGQYLSGDDWSDLKDTGPVSGWDGKGAVLIAAVPDGQLASALGSLKINNVLAFGGSATFQGSFPNNHDPVKDSVSDFLFFDIGDFDELTGGVPNFQNSGDAKANGEVLQLSLSGQASLAWIHFDVMALETSTRGTNVASTIENNPGSHDVTWKDGGGPPQEQLPEPATLVLVGASLLMLAASRRRGLVN